MKKSAILGFLAAVAVAVIASVHGCGEPCSTQTLDASAIGNCGGLLAANTPVTIDISLCTPCAQTQPTCQGDVLHGTKDEIFLDGVVRECQENTGCPTGGTSCATVSCGVSAASPGNYRIVTATAAGGTHDWGSIVVGSGGVTRCPL